MVLHQATWTQILIWQTYFLFGAYSPIEEIMFVNRNLEKKGVEDVLWKVVCWGRGVLTKLHREDSLDNQPRGAWDVCRWNPSTLNGSLSHPQPHLPYLMDVVPTGGSWRTVALPLLTLIWHHLQCVPSAVPACDFLNLTTASQLSSLQRSNHLAVVF